MKRDITGRFVSNWDSEKKQRFSISLTSTAWRSLDEEAHQQGISRSEVIEQMARSFGQNPSPTEQAVLEAKIVEQQEAIALLQRQKQELENQLANTPDSQANEHSVSLILENITDAFVAFDKNWCYTYVNRAAVKILHRNPENLLGKNVWTEIFPSLVGSIAYQNLHRAMTEQIPVSWEEFGEPLQCWLEVNAYPSAYGLAVYFRDITERKQAETERERLLNELEIERSRLEAVLRQMPAGVLIADAAGKLALSNDQAKQILGYSYEPSLEIEQYESITPFIGFNGDGRRYGANDYPLMRSLLTGEVIANEEIYLHYSDGSQIVINVNSAPILNQQNQIVAAVVIFQDVTQRKQIEENLRQTEERLELALSSAQMVAWDMDLITNQVICSFNALSVWGIQVGTAAEFFALIHPDDRQQVIESVRRAIAGEFDYNQDYRVIAPNGATHWLKSQGRVYLDATGQRVRMTGVSVDITEHKQIEAERDRLFEREQAARLEAETERKRLYEILMQLPAMIAIVRGAEHIFEFANPTYLRLTGRTPDIIGKSIREVLPETEGQIYFAQLDWVYQTGEPFIEDESPVYWDNNGDGVLEEAFFNCVFPALRDAEGTIQGVLLHGIDVTTQVRARQQIEQLLQELQHKEKQQQFLIELNDTIRAIQDSKEIMWEVVRTTGQHFQVSRCTYGEIDATQEYVIIDRDYCNGVISIAGSHYMNSFGVEIIAELKQGKTIFVNNVDTDPRTAGYGAVAFDAIQTKSFLCVPLVKEGRFVALFVLHHITPRQWTEDDVIVMERIAQKTWLAVERSRAEEELRHSKTRLQLALMVGRMGTWDWDMQINTLTWSDSHYNIMGLQANEYPPSYELWANSVHPDDLGHTELALQQAMLNKTEYHHEYRTLWENGSIHWTEARGRFLYNAQGQPIQMIGVLIDITERKQAEQERELLLERERIARTQAEAIKRQLETIFDTAPVGMALLDAQQRFVAINEALAQINGLTREQHLGHSVTELFGEIDPNIVALFSEIYTTGKPFVANNFAVNAPSRSDRSPGYYNLYYLPTINSQGQLEDVLAYVIDVTEQVRLERAQRFLAEASAVLASSLDYQTTLDQVAQLATPELADWCTVHIVAADGAIEQIAVAHSDPAKLEWANQNNNKYPFNPNNPRGAALTLRTGQSDIVADIPDELIVQSAHDSEHLEILRSVGFKSVMTVPLRTQARILGVISFVSAESGRSYTQSDLELAEELARRASLAIDNAQLYQLAQSDRAKAEAANRIKDEFLAVLSHELRSPLNPILGWTRILRSQRLDAKKTDQALATIERNAKLQAQLIEDLLDVSRILQGKMTLNVAPVNLASTITAALETVQLAAQAKSIEIQTTINPVAGTVTGDANRLQQILWNLVSNAVKFTPAAGKIEVKLDQVGMYAQIQVKDTGIGIKPEFIPFVFEYFRQEDGTTTRQFGGLGLGLAIVRHFTELHGGTVQASSPGQNLGATFTVLLPLNIVEPQLSHDDGASESFTDLTGINILVVDDDADMRDLAEFILTQSGAQVTTAASALQALTLLKQSTPNLLLCDIGMPEMDGYSLIRQIREWSPEQGGTIPAIALTAYAGEINQQQALAAGFHLHISKPVQPEMLIQAVAQLLQPLS
ncbi:putative two component hybrid sensor regulator [Tolypothrix tenuis PCC 7101]|uniref:Circadian input-output histidine kinase CikA n=1 Tax=Tolypothrix tenuis PCC 7101 TaxID=231146 RepID=A0A1Z4MSC1_9CYAN|nr:PAS domain S-box protein [Aulosira sp. FACHB-113]BAY96387.1 putative two component hybrid sensor regulator [Tolypothrix tenuis PCC 7101]BAZ73105.1 putative two component hybrid sensor regulator [Aulosira laxa NIES-50]